jgi:hypothetical protein
MVDSPGTICSTEAGGSIPLCVVGPSDEPPDWEADVSLELSDEPLVTVDPFVVTTDDVTRSVVTDELFGALVVV